MLLTKVIKFFQLKFKKIKTNHYKIKYFVPSILSAILSIESTADSNLHTKPDSYNYLGNCVVKSEEQKYLGLLRFNNIDEFNDQCKGRMIFLYSEDKCRIFTMKNMKFDIYIEDKHSKRLFKINEEIEVCGKKIVESNK